MREKTLFLQKIQPVSPPCWGLQCGLRPPQHSLSLKSFCMWFKLRTRAVWGGMLIKINSAGLLHFFLLIAKRLHQEAQGLANGGLARRCVKLQESWTNNSVCSSQRGAGYREPQTLMMLLETGVIKAGFCLCSWKRRLPEFMFEPQVMNSAE